MAPVVPMARPRRGTNARAAGLATLLAGAALSTAWLFQARLGSQQADAVAAPAFVGSPRPLLLKRDDNARDVSMFNSRRNKKYYQVKKLHIKFHDRRWQREAMQIPYSHKRLTYLPDWNLEKYAQTLKLTFLPGEEEIVTEDEVRAYFTTDDYAPDGIIFAPPVPWEKDPEWKKKDEWWKWENRKYNMTKMPGVPHTYVHFATIEECQQARKEKGLGDIGKAKEVVATYGAEKKWIRLKDGMRIGGHYGRARWMKPYGDGKYPGWGYHEVAEQTANRDNPFYPY